MKVHRRRTLTAIAAVGALIGAALIHLPAQATRPSWGHHHPYWQLGASMRLDTLDQDRWPGKPSSG